MTKFLRKQLQTGKIHFDSWFQRGPSIRPRRVCQGKAAYIMAAREQRKRIQEELGTDGAPNDTPWCQPASPTSCLSHLQIMLSGDASITSFTGSEFWLIISEWEKLVHGFSVGRGVGQSVEQGLLSHCHTNHGYIMIAVFPRNEKSASWPGPLTLLCLYKLLKEW